METTTPLTYLQVATGLELELISTSTPKQLMAFLPQMKLRDLSAEETLRLKLKDTIVNLRLLILRTTMKTVPMLMTHLPKERRKK
jgi:DNA-binding IclR family transcriptional regulator